MTPNPSASNRRRPTPLVRVAALAAIVAMVVLGAAPSDAAPSTPTPAPSHPSPGACPGGVCPVTTSLQFIRDTNNELSVSFYFPLASYPSSVVVKMHCDDGSTVAWTLRPQPSDPTRAAAGIAIDRSPAAPVVHECTMTQTIPPGWATYPDYGVYLIPNLPPPNDFGYEMMLFDNY